MKKIITILVVVLIVAAVAFTLMKNKETMVKNQTQAEIKSENPVITEKVVKTNLAQNLALVGTVLANNDVMVLSETIGRVVSVSAKVGSNIAKGALIAKVDDELKTAQLQLAEANLEKAKKDYDRGVSLLASKSLTESQFDALKLAYRSAEAQLVIAKRQAADTRIVSPISGVVVTRPVDIGSMVDGKSVIANIVDISSLKLKVNVPETSVNKLKVAQAVEITSEAYPGIKFTGTIDNISAKGDESHTFPVEVKINNNQKEKLRAGMFAKIHFTSIEEHPALIIPRQALIGTTKSASVFVVENGVAKLRKVEIGSEAEAMVEVLSGVNEGEEVITNGQNTIKEGMNVTILNKEGK